ncbi:MAG: hypothetical protein WDM81_03880 [Rhizomicrobium sp.]
MGGKTTKGTFAWKDATNVCFTVTDPARPIRPRRRSATRSRAITRSATPGPRPRATARRRSP